MPPKTTKAKKDLELQNLVPEKGPAEPVSTQALPQAIGEEEAVQNPQTGIEQKATARTAVKTKAKARQPDIELEDAAKKQFNLFVQVFSQDIQAALEEAKKASTQNTELGKALKTLNESLKEGKKDEYETYADKIRSYLAPLKAPKKPKEEFAVVGKIISWFSLSLYIEFLEEKGLYNSDTLSILLNSSPRAIRIDYQKMLEARIQGRPIPIPNFFRLKNIFEHYSMLKISPPPKLTKALIEFSGEINEAIEWLKEANYYTAENVKKILELPPADLLRNDNLNLIRIFVYADNPDADLEIEMDRVPRDYLMAETKAAEEEKDSSLDSDTLKRESEIFPKIIASLQFTIRYYLDEYKKSLRSDSVIPGFVRELEVFLNQLNRSKKITHQDIEKILINFEKILSPKRMLDEDEVLRENFNKKLNRIDIRKELEVLYLIKILQFYGLKNRKNLLAIYEASYNDQNVDILDSSPLMGRSKLSFNSVKLHLLIEHYPKENKSDLELTSHLLTHPQVLYAITTIRKALPDAKKEDVDNLILRLYKHPDYFSDEDTDDLDLRLENPSYPTKEGILEFLDNEKEMATVANLNKYFDQQAEKAALKKESVSMADSPLASLEAKIDNIYFGERKEVSSSLTQPDLKPLTASTFDEPDQSYQPVVELRETTSKVKPTYFTSEVEKQLQSGESYPLPTRLQRFIPDLSKVVDVPTRTVSLVHEAMSLLIRTDSRLNTQENKLKLVKNPQAAPFIINAMNVVTKQAFDRIRSYKAIQEIFDKGFAEYEAYLKRASAEEKKPTQQVSAEDKVRSHLINLLTDAITLYDTNKGILGLGVKIRKEPAPIKSLRNLLDKMKESPNVINLDVALQQVSEILSQSFVKGSRSELAASALKNSFAIDLYNAIQALQDLGLNHSENLTALYKAIGDKPKNFSFLTLIPQSIINFQCGESNNLSAYKCSSVIPLNESKVTISAGMYPSSASETKKPAAFSEAQFLKLMEELRDDIDTALGKYKSIRDSELISNLRKFRKELNNPMHRNVETYLTELARIVNIPKKPSPSTEVTAELREGYWPTLKFALDDLKKMGKCTSENLSALFDTPRLTLLDLKQKGSSEYFVLPKNDDFKAIGKDEFVYGADNVFGPVRVKIENIIKEHKGMSPSRFIISRLAEVCERSRGKSWLCVQLESILRELKSIVAPRRGLSNKERAIVSDNLFESEFRLLDCIELLKRYGLATGRNIEPFLTRYNEGSMNPSSLENLIKHYPPQDKSGLALNRGLIGGDDGEDVDAFIRDIKILRDHLTSRYGISPESIDAVIEKFYASYTEERNALIKLFKSVNVGLCQNKIDEILREKKLRESLVAVSPVAPSSTANPVSGSSVIIHGQFKSSEPKEKEAKGLGKKGPSNA